MINLRKIKIFLENYSDIKLNQIHSESLENCRFHIFAIFYFCNYYFFVTAAVGHPGFPSRLNVKGLHL